MKNRRKPIALIAGIFYTVSRSNFSFYVKQYNSWRRFLAANNFGQGHILQSKQIAVMPLCSETAIGLYSRHNKLLLGGG
jgi:hypothetical protein